MFTIKYEQFTFPECLLFLDLIQYSNDESYVGGLLEVSPCLERDEVYRNDNDLEYDFKYNNKKYRICTTLAYKFYLDGQLIGFIEGKMNKRNHNFYHIDSFGVLQKGKNYGEKILLEFSKYIKMNNFSLCSSLYAINYWGNLEKKLNGIIQLDIS